MEEGREEKKFVIELYSFPSPQSKKCIENGLKRLGGFRMGNTCIPVADSF